MTKKQLLLHSRARAYCRILIREKTTILKIPPFLFETLARILSRKRHERACVRNLNLQPRRGIRPFGSREVATDIENEEIGLCQCFSPIRNGNLRITV